MWAGTDTIDPPLEQPEEDPLLTFASWSEISEMCGDSRVWAGLHFEVRVLVIVRYVTCGVEMLFAAPVMVHVKPLSLEKQNYKCRDHRRSRIRRMIATLFWVLFSRCYHCVSPLIFPRKLSRPGWSSVAATKWPYLSPLRSTG